MIPVHGASAGSLQPRPPGVEAVRIGMPPYGSFPYVLNLDFRSFPPGTVIILELDIRNVMERPTVHCEWIRRLRSLSLGTLLIGHVEPEAHGIAFTAIRRIGVIGIRAYITNTPTLSILREALKASNLIREDVATWLRVRFRDRQLQSLAPDLAGVLCQQRGGRGLELPRDVSGIPTLHKWKMLGKILSPVLLLQCDPEVTVEQAAAGSQYVDTAGFSRACKRIIGYPPSEIRSRLGWEWVLSRFLERLGT